MAPQWRETCQNTEHNKNFTSFCYQTRTYFRLVLTKVLPVLSQFNRPPRAVCDDNRTVHVFLWHGCLEMRFNNIILRHGKEEAHSGNWYCSVELWSTAKHSGPSFRKQTPYARTTQSGLEGAADGPIMLLFPLLSLLIVLASAAMANPLTNNSTERYTIPQIPFPLASADLYLWWLPLYAYHLV